MRVGQTFYRRYNILDQERKLSIQEGRQIVKQKKKQLSSRPSQWWRAMELGPSFAYSLPVHSFHTRRDRVASLTPCRLHGAATQRASPLGPGRALTLPCGWNIAGHADASKEGGFSSHTAKSAKEQAKRRATLQRLCKSLCRNETLCNRLCDNRSAINRNGDLPRYLRLMVDEVSDLPCDVRREGGQSLVIGGSSLVILEVKACNPL